MTLNLDRSSWQKVKFGDVVRNVNDNLKDPASAGIKRMLGLEHLDPGELRIQRWGDVSQESTFTRRVRPGQTLFGKRRAYQRKTAYAEFDAVCSGDILVFESADPARLLPELLPFIAMTDAFYAMALETSAGSLSPRTRWSDIAKYEFELPPLDQQRRIGDLFWAIEDAMTSQVALVAALDGAVTALTGSLKPGRRTVGDVLTMARAGATPLRSRSDFYGGGIPWLKSGEVTGDAISGTEESLTELGLQESSAVLIPAGATCVAMYGDGKTRGSVGRIARSMATNQAVLALVPDIDKADSDFLYLWMLSRTEHLRQKSGGAAQKNLSKTLVTSEPFPDLTVEDQRSLVETWQEVREARSAVKMEIRSLEVVRAAATEFLIGGGDR